MAATPTAAIASGTTIGRATRIVVVEARRAEGDANLHVLDGLLLFGPDDVADLPDLLHPNPAGYRRMGERFHELAFANGGPFAG